MDKFKYWIILFFVSQSAHALTTCNVTLSSDNNPGDIGDPGDLRYCLNTMNQSLNTIPDDYAILFDFSMTIQLNGILPVINNSSNPVNITIGNPGSIPTVTIDGNSGAYSGFFIPIGNVTIQNMNFQNLTAKGGDGGDGISGGGGGLGAGGAIYVPQSFLYGSNPSVTLMNVSIDDCSAVGGNGGSYSPSLSTGYEGGGGGGGFSGNGGSITTSGITGGAGGGGFGGDGGNVTLSDLSPESGGGGGGGGWGSRATIGTINNLGSGGSDQAVGMDGNGYGLSPSTAGSGGGGNIGGNNAGGGGGGSGTVSGGGGGGGAGGSNGLQPQGSIPPREIPTQGSIKKQEGKSVNEVLRELSVRSSKTMEGKVRLSKTEVQDTTVTLKAFDDAVPSGGNGGDGAGGGGGAIVVTFTSNEVDGSSGNGGYGGGGGGAAGAGASDSNYTVQGGSGGVGGGGGGGGVNISSITPATGGDSFGGGGGGGGGPSNGPTAMGGSDVGNLGGGSGGFGANTAESGSGGGGGGGGSGLGGAIFVDSGLNFTIQALSGVPTTFNTSNNTTQSGSHGTGAPGGSDGLDGSALGNSIFLRSNSSLTLMAEDADDILTLGDQVAFTDDTNFGAGGTVIFVRGNGTVIYNGTTDYQGAITINDTNFKVNGVIEEASVFVCRFDVSSKRGMLSGTGTLTGDVFVNSGTISPDAGGTLNLGGLILNAAGGGSLGSLVHTNIDPGGTSSVIVTGPATLAGILEINLDSTAVPGQYTLLTSSGITGTFDSVTFTGRTPNYTISYLPVGSPTFVQLDFLGYPSSVNIPATVNGSPILNPAVVCCGRPIILGDLPVPGSGPTVYSVTGRTGSVTCELGQTQTQQYLKMQGKSGSCTIVGTKDGVTSNPLTVIAS